jgi:hypothetical protein
MDGRRGRGQCESGKSIGLWRDFPGGSYPDGSVVTIPPELDKALFLLRIGERFGKFPSEVAAEDAGLIRMLTMEALAKPPEQEGEPEYA